MKTRWVLCDFDGTLIEGDLERMFMRYLLTIPSLRYKILLVSFFTLPINLLLNYFSYPSVFKSWTFVLGDKTSDYIHQFLLANNHLIRLKQRGWDCLQQQTDCHRMLLTGCYEDLVKQYLAYNHLLDSFDRICATTMKNTFLVSSHPYAKGKVPFVNPQYYNIGIANEKKDRFYMDLCDERYYV